MPKQFPNNRRLLRPDKSIRDGIGKGRCPPRNDIMNCCKIIEQVVILFFPGMRLWVQFDPARVLLLCRGVCQQGL